LLDNPANQIFVRGKGPLELLLIGIDQSSKELLTRLTNHTCPIDESAEPKLAQILRERVRLHILPQYSQSNILSYMQKTKADSLLIFSSGPPHSVVFNAGEYTPRLFDQRKFDESLEKYCRIHNVN
jgi:hypothetical protein